MPVPAISILADLENRFRHLLLKRLYRAQRLSEAFLNKLLAWNPSGFSVYASQLVFDDEPDRLERLARYLTRAPIPVDAVRSNDNGPVELSTLVTGDTALQLDPLDWIHALCEQIPDRGQHLTRSYGAYANRTRKAVFRLDAPEPEPQSNPDSPSTSASRASWARLIRKVFEVDPLLCPNCGAEMKVLAVITEPKVVHRILSHLHTRASPARPSPPSVGPHQSVHAF